jgi:hypothetical protein
VAGDSWVTDVHVGDAEWSETAASKLTQEMNAAPTKFDRVDIVGLMLLYCFTGAEKTSLIDTHDILVAV